MKDDVSVRKLVEFIFVNKFKVTSEMTAQNSSFPPSLLTNDFTQKLRQVLAVRESIIYLKCARDIGEFYSRDILCDHKSYIRYVVYTCLGEHKCQSNVFESFIAVCSSVKFFSDLTLLRTGLNYCELNTDIVMQIYESVLEKTFLRRNGFKRLVEYISTHKYLAWDLDLVQRAVHAHPLANDMKEKLSKEKNRELKIIESFKREEYALRTSSIDMATRVLLTTSVKLPIFSSNHGLEDTATKSTESMAQEVLSKTSVEFPNFSSDHDSSKRVNTSRLSNETKAVKGKGAIEADLKFEPVETSQGSSSPYAKTHIEAKQPETIAWYESVVQAVVKYNQSETAGFVSSDNSIQKITGSSGASERYD